LNSLRFVCTLGVCLLGSIPSQASLLTYTDFTTWSAAVGPTSTLTIPDPGGSGSATAGSGGFTFSGFNFTTTAVNSTLFQVGPPFGANPPVLSDQAINVGDTTNILITLPFFVTAIALNYSTSGGTDVAFTLSNGDTTTQSSTGPAYGTRASSGSPIPRLSTRCSWKPLNLVSVSSASTTSRRRAYFRLRYRNQPLGCSSPPPDSCSQFLRPL
jgi:hypothetical protein